MVTVACVASVCRDSPRTLALDRKSESHSALSPLAVSGYDIFSYKRYWSGLTNQLVFVRVGFRCDQRKHGSAVWRRNPYPALSGLNTHIKGEVESQLIYIEPQASVLIAHENIDCVNAKVRVNAIRRQLDHGPLL